MSADGAHLIFEHKEVYEEDPAVFAPRTCDSAWRWNEIHRSWAHFLREGPPIWISYWKLPFISIEIVDLPIRNGDFPIKNGDFPIKNGDFPIKNGDLPIKIGDFRVRYVNVDQSFTLSVVRPGRRWTRPLFLGSELCTERRSSRAAWKRTTPKRCEWLPDFPNREDTSWYISFLWLPTTWRYITDYYGMYWIKRHTGRFHANIFQHVQLPEIFLKFPENSKLKMLQRWIPVGRPCVILVFQKVIPGVLRRWGWSGRWCCHQLG